MSSRIETLLKALLNGETSNIKPRSRVEAYLLALAKKGLGGGVSSWNDLTDKPFGEEQAFEPIVWEHDSPVLNSLTVDIGVGVAVLEKFSNDYIQIESKTDVDNVVLIGSQDDTIAEQIIKGEEFGVEFGEHGWMGGNGLVVSSDGEHTQWGVTIPKGLWTVIKTFIPSAITFTVNPSIIYHKLDEKYMPTLTSPSAKKFKITVDDSGTISATEVT